VEANGIRLHYLDWGGSGTVLLFLAGMGSSAYIYDEFAPRFVENFHVIALSRRGHGDSDYPTKGYDVHTLTDDLRQCLDALEIESVILVGHSMANVEMCHFAALYPDRVLKLIFLDAAMDRTSAAFKAMIAKNPVGRIEVPGALDDHYSFEEYAASVRKHPMYAAVWCQAIEEDLSHAVRKSDDGRITDKMSMTIGGALRNTLSTYVPEDSKIQAPVLSFYALSNADDFLSVDYIPDDLKTLIAEYYDTIRPPLQREVIEQFRRDVPHAKIVEIPDSHHCCFIKNADLVFDEMQKFLLA
jgi:non-heme chloroperoxidase